VTSISVTPEDDTEPPVATAAADAADDAGESSGAARRLNFWSR
jgi:hypothetical protein